MTVPPLRFRPDLEGLRAVAVLLVVGHHVGAPLADGGFVGVDVFFVLSGYLITWLLVHEAQSMGRIAFGRFYARRARRLLPALAVVLTAVAGAALVLLAPFEQARVARSSVAAALYVSNLAFAALRGDYFAASTQHDPLLHTWSLGVEEQFYLAWPLVIAVAVAGAGGRRPILWLGALTAVSLAASLWLTAEAPTWAFYLSPTRAWQFGAGGLAALLPLAAGARAARARGLLGWLGLAALGAASAAFGPTTPYPGVAALLPVAGTVLVLRAGMGPAGAAAASPARLLSVAPLREIGRLSYSWYLWHWPALVFLDLLGGPPSPAWRLTAAAGTLALAKATYHLVEAPVRHHPALTERPRRTLAGAALLTTGVGALAGGWMLLAGHWSGAPAQAAALSVLQDALPVYEDGCAAPIREAELVECRFGAEEAPRTAVLLGDSQAGRWSPLLDPLVASGRWRVITLIKVACPLLDIEHHSPFVGRRFHECETWRARAIDRVEALRPDLVVVGSGLHYPFAPAEWSGGLARALAPLAEASEALVVLGGLRMPRYDVPACLARQAWAPSLARPCADAEDAPPHVREALQGFASSRPDVAVFDVSPYLCGPAGCPVARDGRPIYRDLWHVAQWVAEAAAPDFARAVEALEGRGPATTRRASAP